MSNTKIEWTEQTWNPIIGCSHISPGCDNCYAEKMAGRLSHIEGTFYYQFTQFMKNLPAKGVKMECIGWNGKTHFVESQLEKPLKRKKPTMYFVCSMGDLFHESVPFEWIDKVMAVIAISQQHTFQILTKRPYRMLEYFQRENIASRVMCEIDMLNEDEALFDKCCKAASKIGYHGFKLFDNVWLGVTAENQGQANKRIPILLQIPAAVRFVSIEPMLGAINLNKLDISQHNIRSCIDTLYEEADCLDKNFQRDTPFLGQINWVICGGETGPNARPMHPDWVRSLRDQCKGADVPFFFKQWGEWKEGDSINPKKTVISLDLKGNSYSKEVNFADWLDRGFTCMVKLGKKKAGHLLNRVEHREFPKGGQQ